MKKLLALLVVMAPAAALAEPTPYEWAGATPARLGEPAGMTLARCATLAVTRADGPMECASMPNERAPAYVCRKGDVSVFVVKSSASPRYWEVHLATGRDAPKLGAIGYEPAGKEIVMSFRKSRAEAVCIVEREETTGQRMVFAGILPNGAKTPH